MTRQIDVTVRAVTRYIINVHTESEQFGERHVRDEQQGGEIANLDQANAMADAIACREAKDSPDHHVEWHQRLDEQPEHVSNYIAHVIQQGGGVVRRPEPLL